MGCTNKRKNESQFQVIYGDVTLGIRGESANGEFHYIFSYAAGGPESLVINGMEWLYRSPRPCFWRGLTDNDRGNKFHEKSGGWLATDMFIRCVHVTVLVNGTEIPLPCAPENNKYTDKEKAQKIEIIYTYETILNPETQVDVSYQIEGNGKIQVNVHYYGKKGLPELPVFGMRFVMPTTADKFLYEGLSGETYPDRKAGGLPGIYQVEGLPVTPYLVPQDCGMHMDTKWVEIYRSKVLDNTKRKPVPTAIRFEMDKKAFAFSCLPYTASELENATHREELPPARRTVLCIYGAVRGVGGIDSWGTDVESGYHIDGEKDIIYSFQIVPKCL